MGITGGQAALLHLVRSNPGIGVRELAGRKACRLPRMSTALNRLEAAGLLRRMRAQHDRRRVGLELTDAGPAGAALRALAPHGLAGGPPEAADARPSWPPSRTRSCPLARLLEAEPA